MCILQIEGVITISKLPDKKMILKYEKSLNEIAQLNKTMFTTGDLSSDARKELKDLKFKGIIRKAGERDRISGWVISDGVLERVKKVLNEEQRIQETCQGDG